MIILFILVGALAAETAAVQPSPVSIYTYNRDSEHGFGDEHLDAFRQELGKYASPVMELAYTRESAVLTVQFLGQGELSVELGPNGHAVGHRWTPDDEAPRMWAIVRLPSTPTYSKEFSVVGSGGRDLSRLAKAIGDWVQQNSTRIREP